MSSQIPLSPWGVYRIETWEAMAERLAKRGVS